MKLSFLLLFLTLSLQAQMKSYAIVPQNFDKTEQNSINILDSVELNFAKFDGVKVSEISAIAYKKNILYALGDGGALYHFKLKIKNDKIKKLQLKKAIKLQTEDKKDLKKEYRDSEGLAFYGKKLLISYERVPRVELRTKSGKYLQLMQIDKKLQKAKNYVDENKGLESIAYNPKYGIITAPELPLKGKKKKYHTLYSKDKKWKFRADGSVTSLEFMNKNEIMILQRDFQLYTSRRKTVIGKLNLQTGTYTVLAKLDSNNGWRLDNFEGLAKVDDNRYLMISDDNDWILQKTVLVLFGLK